MLRFLYRYFFLLIIFLICIIFKLKKSYMYLNLKYILGKKKNKWRFVVIDSSLV